MSATVPCPLGDRCLSGVARHYIGSQSFMECQKVSSGNHNRIDSNADHAVSDFIVNSIDEEEKSFLINSELIEEGGQGYTTLRDTIERVIEDRDLSFLINYDKDSFKEYWYSYQGENASLSFSDDNGSYEFAYYDDDSQSVEVDDEKIITWTENNADMIINDYHKYLTDKLSNEISHTLEQCDPVRESIVNDSIDTIMIEGEGYETIRSRFATKLGKMERQEGIPEYDEDTFNRFFDSEEGSSLRYQILEAVGSHELAFAEEDQYAENNDEEPVIQVNHDQIREWTDSNINDMIEGYRDYYNKARNNRMKRYLEQGNLDWVRQDYKSVVTSGGFPEISIRNSIIRHPDANYDDIRDALVTTDGSSIFDHPGSDVLKESILRNKNISDDQKNGLLERTQTSPRTQQDRF